MFYQIDSLEKAVDYHPVLAANVSMPIVLPICLEII
jgi:hypothetical protein